MEEHDSEPVDEFSKEDMDRIFKEAIEAVENLHNSLTQATEYSGYARQIISESHPRYTVLFDKSQDDPSLYPLVASGLGFLRNATIQFNKMAGLAGEITYPLMPVVNSTGTFAGTTNAALEFGLVSEQFEPLPALPSRKSREEYSSQLKALDIALSDSYEQVWQIYYGTSADRYRAALFMMRQVFDHFFYFLAPDDIVHESPYWTKKKGDKPDQIYRSERVMYAAHTHVEDPELAETLASSAKQINNLYKAANNAHSRGTLDENSANKAVLAMDNMLRDWIDAIS
jgi:hypothetical protein